MSIKVAQKMISQEKWMILTPFQKLPNNVGHLGKIIVATSFEWLPEIKKIAQSGHTDGNECKIRLPSQLKCICRPYDF